MFKIELNKVIAALLTIVATIQGNTKNVVSLYEIILENLGKEE